jgi:hypothetical protein
MTIKQMAQLGKDFTQTLATTKKAFDTKKHILVRRREAQQQIHRMHADVHCRWPSAVRNVARSQLVECYRAAHASPSGDTVRACHAGNQRIVCRLRLPRSCLRSRRGLSKSCRAQPHSEERRARVLRPPRLPRGGGD